MRVAFKMIILLSNLRSPYLTFSDLTYVLGMARRTYEADAEYIETADDLDDLVQDKREGWRANSSKARRRQRRYKKRLTHELIRNDYSQAADE